jgi:hypothetical protein
MARQGPLVINIHFDHIGHVYRLSRYGVSNAREMQIPVAMLGKENPKPKPFQNTWSDFSDGTARRCRALGRLICTRDLREEILAVF